MEWRPDPKDREAFLDALDAAADAVALTVEPGAGDGGAPTWWDEGEAGAEALAVARRLGGRH